MGELFEKSEFAYSDSSIENLLNPLDGWRLPTQPEVSTILDGSRIGSTVSSVSGVRWAFIRLSGTSYGAVNNPYGLLLFPDGEDITGKALDAVNIVYDEGEDEAFCTENVTLSELNEYLSQGCVFFPVAGTYYDNPLESYWTSTQWSIKDGGDIYGACSLVISSSYIDINENDGKNNNLLVRLVRPIE